MIYTSIGLVLLFWAGVFYCILPQDSLKRVQDLPNLATVVSSWRGTNDVSSDQRIIHSSPAPGPAFAHGPGPAPITRQHGYFLHITDMHVDADYQPGATVKSACHDMPSLAAAKSHRKKPKNQKVLVGGRLGAPGEHCDAPIELAERTIDWLVREWRDKLDFIVWTGDNSRHDWDKKDIPRTRKQVYKLNQHMTDVMIDAFWPTVPVVPALGNNDVYPANKIGDAKIDSSLLAFYERLWRHWIPKEQRDTFKDGGYFSIQVAPNLRIISLNTLFFSSRNKAVKHCKKGTPAHRHMEWLDNELAETRKEGSRAYIIGHVPPSTRDYRNTCLDEYLRISSVYSDILLGHFYGHLNMDHFLLYDGRPDLTEELIVTNVTESDESDDMLHTNRNLDKYVNWLRDMYESIEAIESKKNSSEPPPAQDPQAPVVVVQIAPSVLPAFFPTVRIYRYETSTNPNEDTPTTKPYGTPLGFDQYFANITRWEEAQENGTTPLDYQLEYTTEDAYGLRDLTAESYLELVKSMVKTDKAGDKLWTTYINNMFVQTMNDTYN
ncbi:Metallo-dependent phosphatase-like protein [Phycomyces blakesleeanus]